MFINNLNKRERYLAVATVAVVSTAFLYAFLVAPIYARWRALNEQIQSRVNMLETDFKILVNQKTSEVEYAKLSKRTKIAKSEEQTVAATLDYIENVSRNDSCLIVNIKPAGVTNEGPYKEILVDVSVEANINQLSKFLYDIENPRDALINIKRFTITTKSTQTDLLKGTFLISKALLD